MSLTHRIAAAVALLVLGSGSALAQAWPQRPVRVIVPFAAGGNTDQQARITAERLSDRLPVHNPHDELGRLATVFNETLGRLEESFDQMRRFTADVSHELRTPLTAIRSVGEVARPDRARNPR